MGWGGGVYSYVMVGNDVEIDDWGESDDASIF